MKTSKYLFEFQGKKYFYKDIVGTFKKIGIKKGDKLFVHSDLKTFGKINPKVTKEDYVDNFIKALSSLVGEMGTIIVPTFSYSFCKNLIYDPENTPSTVGILTERFRKIKGTVRTIDPIFSTAVWGNNKEYYRDIGSNCFGENSIFQKIYINNFKILLIGNTFDMTYIHFIEQDYNVPYRYIKKFKGKIAIDGRLKECVYDYNVKPLDSGIKYDLNKISNFLDSKGVLKKCRLGYSQIRLVGAVDAYNKITEGLKKNVRIFLKNRQYDRDRGGEMHNLVKQLFPICRSITGNGVRATLKIIQKHVPIKIYEVPSGTKAFDWTVPKEWNIADAYVADDDGNKIIDFKKNNLHVVGYSIPVNKTVNLPELKEHLHSLPDQPEAIPFVFSYYKERWGLCIRHKDREKLKEGRYKVFIDSELKNGSLTYGELVIPGESEKEVFLSTYVCHPSMANNELSGPIVTTFLVRWILSKPRKYTYRIIFIPETIGSIVYLSKNIEAMKKNIIAGFNISCVGDNRVYSYLPTRNGNTLADKVALNILSFKHPGFIKYSFLDRGSDERQYNAPGVDLPVCCVMRSKYGAYPEYHTSLDNLDFVNSEGLSGSYNVLKECIKLIEKNQKYKIKCLGEPHLGKRGLYPTISTKLSPKEESMKNFIAYADGKNDLIDISNIINVPAWELYPIIEKLAKANLLTSV